MAEKTYLKMTIRKRDGKYGPILKCAMKASEMVELAQTHANSKGLVRWDVMERKSIGKYDQTHNAVLDEWEPGDRSDQVSTRPPAPTTGTPRTPSWVPDDEIPFAWLLAVALGAITLGGV